LPEEVEQKVIEEKPIEIAEPVKEESKATEITELLGKEIVQLTKA